MGLITGSDGDLHYEDGSHWRPAPFGVSEDLWRTIMKAHIAAHAAGEEPARQSPRDGTPPPTSGPTPRPTS